MAYVVLCGPAHHAPDRIVGPFEASDDAARYAEGHPGAPERYAVVESLTPPSTERPVVSERALAALLVRACSICGAPTDRCAWEIISSSSSRSHRCCSRSSTGGARQRGIHADEPNGLME